MIMKKEYLLPDTAVFKITCMERAFCNGSELDSLEEKDDLGGFDWNYN